MPPHSPPSPLPSVCANLGFPPMLLYETKMVGLVGQFAFSKVGYTDIDIVGQHYIIKDFLHMPIIKDGRSIERVKELCRKKSEPSQGLNPGPSDY